MISIERTTSKAPISLAQISVLDGVTVFLRRTGRALYHAVYLPVALLLRLFGFRILQLTHPDRIGHLVGELDCLVKEERLGRATSYRGILLAREDRVANQHILTYWDQHFFVVRSARACAWLAPVAWYGLARYRPDISQYFSAIGSTALYNDIYSAWGARPPLLELRQEDRERGEAVLRKLGLPDNAKFVCFHARHGAYSPSDEHLHRYRNASVESYLPAMLALREQGLYGIRMGDATAPAFAPVDGLVDYASSHLRSDWMDVFLCARCEFFLGSSSGLYLLSTAFGRPCALANLTPMSSALSGGPTQLCIPKLLWSETEGRYLTFAEALELPTANYRLAEQYRQAGLTTPENDADDVKALAMEMLERVRGQAQYTSADEDLQQRFRSLFRPGHYGYGSAARIGRDFLRKYSTLLRAAAPI